MFDRRMFFIRCLACVVAAFAAAGCERKKTVRDIKAKAPAVVSLVPSASDIINGIGAGDHLAAVSNYDTDPQTAHLPHVGDYMATDWERIAPLEPKVVVTQYAQGRTPDGFRQRLETLHAKQVNIRLDTLSDIYDAITQLGDACDEHDKGLAARAALVQTIESIRRRVSNEPPVSALIVLGPEGSSVAGPGTFLDELLTAAGGQNAAAGLGTYPTIDREQLAARAPQVIIQLLPAAGPQVLRQAEENWASARAVPAVKNGRVVRFTEWYVMHSGYQVGTLCQRMAEALHPSILNAKATSPSSRSSPGTEKH